MYGLTTTPATSASLLLNLEPVFTALLAWYLFRENFDRRIAIGMAAIVAGGFVLAWAPVESGRSFSGPLLIGLACLCWALDNNLTRKVSTSDAFGIAALKGVVAGAVNTGLALALGYALPPLPIIGAAAAVGFLGYGVSLMLFVLHSATWAPRGRARISPSRRSSAPHSHCSSRAMPSRGSSSSPARSWHSVSGCTSPSITGISTRTSRSSIRTRTRTTTCITRTSIRKEHPRVHTSMCTNTCPSRTRIRTTRTRITGIRTD